MHAATSAQALAAKGSPGIRSRFSATSDSLRLGLLFGTMYFVQGMGEPTEGLVTQPVRSILKHWGFGVSEIAGFAALLALPWWLKPIYGLVSDFIPLAGYRRRSYLVIAGTTAAISFLGVFLFPVPFGARWLLLATLVLPTVAVAWSDVVIDALMVERGQPRGITGHLQAVQWGAMWSATIVAGLIGGYLSQQEEEYWAFLICGLLSAVGLLMAIVAVREPKLAAVHHPRALGELPRATAELWRAVRVPQVVLVIAFLMLWNFAPFSTAVLYVHMTEQLGMSEQFYGETVSLMAGGALVASVAYGFVCRRVGFLYLVHASILCGVLSIAAYWLLAGERSAAVISLAVGFFHMTGTMVQLDLAARCCPLRAAGTVFAAIMALSNLSLSIATGLGGIWYDQAQGLWGPAAAFNSLVALGVVVTAGCWLLTPAFRRHLAAQPTEPTQQPVSSAPAFTH
ncbi:MAG: MFS transporter [Pirellulales bacterium]|nr:MFS transporter [Pirellulales bacterium]